MDDYRVYIILTIFSLILFWVVLFSPNAYISAAVIITDIIGAVLGFVYLIDKK